MLCTTVFKRSERLDNVKWINICIFSFLMLQCALIQNKMKMKYGLSLTASLHRKTSSVSVASSSFSFITRTNCSNWTPRAADEKTRDITLRDLFQRKYATTKDLSSARSCLGTSTTFPSGGREACKDKSLTEWKHTNSTWERLHFVSVV